MDKEIRISLNSEDFGKLVKGEIVEKDNVKIALQDIGFYEMGKCFAVAIADANKK